MSGQFHANAAVHAASLVHPATHSPVVLTLINIDISPSVIQYVVDCVSVTVNYAMHTCAFTGKYISQFPSFVSVVLKRAQVTPAILITTLVYITRIRPHLSLIVASKYTNDSTLKNVHWAICTGVFRFRDVGRIEREFLDVLDWNLRVTERDLLEHRYGLLGNEQ
ncbi:hypothetical protein R3P38DRAFT_3322442 [Favolaschia claudopus]|uniref:Cyclin N-terminal domain-containing protein n=1 Tax=Favolaschia claudopus TaxID=2862362 RepID=A0AAW0ALE8_9AGAR